ncbi:lytic polysaccharide monooxygenase auxiliary activity family 9 protein [Streptomyces gobiensis]|uniref:lytic polysaccharide monooxygenase auxiliary activity family 9 protein n=1 Tax=Streptomyces gobiensis TaxID=2875706 RepID=UPI001E60C733|nr:lytic polysaccharide monooxygenase [Streptomyces gobiensis]UGY90578.1 lytic polysaccharide monooxygenase [Streptomyces gobiensis]
MTVRRKATALAALGVAPLAVTGLAASPAVAHGSMTDPVSRVSACYAEGPESPRSAACKAAVAASGAQAFYDWNEVNIGDAAGRHREIIPDGKLCSAGRDKYKGLDLPRTDWPAAKLSSGDHTFTYKGTAPHKGSFELYITKDGYDPSKPLTWSDLETKPFAKVTDPRMEGGDYVFNGTIPNKSGRHLIYSIWQRSDSPEAFYTCSDVTFGGDSGGSGTGTSQPADSQPAAPTEKQIEENRDKSTVDHNGHGGDGKHSGHDEHGDQQPQGDAEVKKEAAPNDTAQNDTRPKGGSGDVNLAETGGDDSTSVIAMGGATALALGAAVLFATLRRRALGRHRA